MRLLIAVQLLFLFLFSCGTATDQNLAGGVSKTVHNDLVFAETKVGNFHLSLIEKDGGCVLDYTNDGKSREPDRKLIKLEIAAPCNFIRKPGKTSEVMRFLYGKTPERTVIMIVGGPPDSSQKDEFLPNGCGTQLQAVRIFDERIEVSGIVIPGFYSTTCPSEGLDEDFFAAEAFSHNE